MTKRLVPIVAGVVAFALCILVFWLEGIAFISIRSRDFRDASTGDLLVGNEHENPNCVGYSNPEDVDDMYVDAKRGLVYPLALPFSFWGVEVKCSDDVSRKALGKLLAVNVHALHYSVTHPGHIPTTHTTDTGGGLAHITGVLRRSRDAALTSALGGVGQTNYSEALTAMLHLAEPPKTCEEIYETATAGSYAPLLLEPVDKVDIACFEIGESNANTEYDASDAAQVQALYTHCAEQFQFGRFSAEYEPWSYGWLQRGTGGTLGVPVHGLETRPASVAWFDPPGYNSSTAPGDRARLMTGMRYGWAIFAAVPVVLLTAILTMDAILFIIVEITVEERIEDTAAVSEALSGSVRNTLYAVLVMYATANATRFRRTALAMLGWASILILRCVFVWAPFNFGKILPRPHCNAGSGWETDETTASLEWSTLWILFVIIWLQPISKTECLSVNHLQDFADADNDRNLSIAPRAKRTQQFVLIGLLGALVVLFVQAYAAILFGEGWAEAVTSPTRVGAAFADANGWANAVYTKAVGSFAIAGAAGGLIASIQGRWYFSGRSFCSCLSLTLWLLLACITLLPVVLTDDLSFDRDRFNEDCEKAFPDDDDESSGRRDRCEMRYWGTIVGLIILVVPLALLLCFCVFRNAFSALYGRARGEVNGDDPVLREANQKVQEGEHMEAGNVIAGVNAHAGFFGSPRLSLRKRSADELPLLRMEKPARARL